MAIKSPVHGILPGFVSIGRNHWLQKISPRQRKIKLSVAVKIFRAAWRRIIISTVTIKRRRYNADSRILISGVAQRSNQTFAK